MTHDDRQVDEVLARLEKPPRSYWAPLMIALTVLLALSITTVVLAVVVASGNNDRQHTDHVTNCRNLYTSQITASAQVAADSATQVVIEIARSLTNDATPEQRRASINGAIRTADGAAAANVAAIDARDGWVKAGSPLPCPLSSG